jgi:hypothetical protein
MGLLRPPLCLPHEAAGRADDLERAELVIPRKVKDDLGQPNACVFNLIRMIPEVGRHRRPFVEQLSEQLYLGRGERRTANEVASSWHEGVGDVDSKEAVVL